ncbi:hypothetical protein IW262DRAFT_1297620 [Armillaria fumosa]|nr:hypothetical protein IW262DRAFT_1297620 [Armillaria fumosa]
MKRLARLDCTIFGTVKIDIEQFAPRDNHVVETSSTGTRLKAAVKRYRPENGGAGLNEAGYILVFAHGTGFPWAVDAQTHGAFAAMNEETIETPEFNYLIQDYAEAALGRGFGGVCTLPSNVNDAEMLIYSALSTAFCDRTPFHAMVLVEPTVWPADITNIHSPMFILASKTIPRPRDFWASKDEAKAYLKKRAPWSLWDNLILDIYIEYGIVPHPTNKGVSLACTPRHEAMPFITGDSVVPLTELDKTHKIIPIHLVYGERNDLFTREKQNTLQRGRNFASVTRIPGAGHLICHNCVVVQEAPDKVGDVIFNILQDNAWRCKL